MRRRTTQMRVDPSLIEIFSEMQKAGKVSTFAEFSRLVASDFKKKKSDNLRLFK